MMWNFCVFYIPSKINPKENILIDADSITNANEASLHSSIYIRNLLECAG